MRSRDADSENDDIPIDERRGAEFIDAVETSADSMAGEGLSVELWRWDGQYFLRSTDADPESEVILGRSLSISDWHDLGKITEKRARVAMDDLLGELGQRRSG